jgi:hypothetical protein
LAGLTRYTGSTFSAIARFGSDALERQGGVNHQQRDTRAAAPAGITAFPAAAAAAPTSTSAIRASASTAAALADAPVLAGLSAFGLPGVADECSGATRSFSVSRNGRGVTLLARLTVRTAFTAGSPAEDLWLTR